MKYKVIDTEEIETIINDDGIDIPIKVVVVRMINIVDKYRNMNCCIRSYKYLVG